MACEITMNGVTYTREEWDNLPIIIKIEVLLRSPNLEKYMKLGTSRLRNGGVFTEVPVAQESYDNAKSELRRVIDHAISTREKIKEVFGQHMDKKQVGYSLILLDTLAQAWSERTGLPKESYYQRYQDVQQITADNLLNKDNVLNQVIGQIGAESLDDLTEGIDAKLALFRAVNYEKDFGISKSDWADPTIKNAEKTKIKQLTGWERGTSGNWMYEIPDGQVTNIELLQEETPTNLSEIFDSEILYLSYPQLRELSVYKFKEEGLTNAYVWRGEIYINENIINDADKIRKSILHEIYHIISEIEGFPKGSNAGRFEKQIRDIIQYVRSGNPKSTLSKSNGEFRRVYERMFGNTRYSFETLKEESIREVANYIYYNLEGETFARNIETRSERDFDTNRDSLLSDTESVGRADQISNISFQIIGENGVVNLSDSVNRLQNLQLAKRMSSQNAPAGVVKRLTGWEQEDGIWKTETDDLWNFSVKRMPKAETTTTLGELIGDAEVFDAYPQLRDINITFDNFDGYFSASYQPALNKIDVNKQYITNLNQLKSSLVHELQHAVQEIEGWQQGSNPEDAGSVENYRNAVGEVEARNASTRMNLTNLDKLESVLSDTADVAPEDRVYVERVSDLAAQLSTPESTESTDQSYQDLQGNTIEGTPINYSTEFGELSYIRDENGDLIMVRPVTTPSVERDMQAALTNRTSDGLIYRAAVEAINNKNQFILYAIDNPDLGSLVHEFMHVAEQDLDDGDLETMEQWSGYNRGTTEFQEAVADGFVKFISEGIPEVNAINAVFNKIAKLLKQLYRSITSSPLQIKLNDDVRILYAKILGVEQSFSRRLKNSTEGLLELSNSQRKDMLSKLGRGLKRYAPSQLRAGTQVVKKDGSIGVVGREDLSGTTAQDRRDGITELLTYPLLTDLAGVYENDRKIKPYNGLAITPSCT